MSKSNPLGGMNQGYGSRNKWNLKKKDLKKIVHYAGEDKKFPSGFVPPISITIVCLVALGLALGLTPPGYSDEQHQFFLYKEWYNIVWYVLGAGLCIVGLWAIGRTGLFSLTRFGMMKFSRILKLDVLKEKITKNDYAINYVNNLDEYEEFLILRKKETKKPFMITWITYLSVFGAWTIVMTILNITLN